MGLLRLLPRFRAAEQAVREMERRERWPRADLDALQLERLNNVWQHARDHVRYYAELSARLGLPRRFASLDEFHLRVPVLNKQAVRDRPGDFLSQRPGWGSWTRTGGATGSPTDVFWGNQASLEMLRGRYRFLAAWGVDFLDKSAYLWGHSSCFRPGLRGWLERRRRPVEDWLRNRLRLSAYHLGPDDLRRYLARIARFRPAFVYSYPRALALLAHEALAQGFRCDSLRLAVVTGEPASAPVVEAIDRAFRVPVAVEYGSCECGFVAGQYPDGTLRVREEHIHVETLPRPDGRYDLAFTALDNPSFPLLRYAIGDVTDAPLEKPPHGLAILKNVIGRTNDLVYTRNGRPVHATRFEALFKYEIDNVRRFRVHQHVDGSLLVTLEMQSALGPANRALLARAVGEVVEGYPVQVDIVTAFPQTPAGKHRLVVSEMDQPSA